MSKFIFCEQNSQCFWTLISDQRHLSGLLSRNWISLVEFLEYLLHCFEGLFINSFLRKATKVSSYLYEIKLRLPICIAHMAEHRHLFVGPPGSLRDTKRPRYILFISLHCQITLTILYQYLKTAIDVLRRSGMENLIPYA